MDGVITQKDVLMSLKRFLAATVGSLAIAVSSLFAQDPSLYTELEPTTIFSGGAQYLVMNRDSNLCTEARVINGPDSGNVGFLNTSFSYTAAFVGTVGLQSSVPLSNHWSLIGGYEATFIHGVALAPDQNMTGSTGSTYSIDTHGNVLVHGADAGLQFMY